MSVSLAIVVPCYNEEDVLPETGRRLLSLMDRLEASGSVGPTSRIIFVDDGSVDRTWQLISELSASHARIGGIKLSGNRGHQNALLAGLFAADADAVITVDADLQDDLDVIIEMIRSYGDGAEIVYGVRSSRNADTRFKKLSAESYYRLLGWMGARVVFNHADYRLMSRRAIDCLRDFREVNLFLRGIVPLIGLKTATVTYARAERYAGVSKYPIRKMLALALDGITSFSVTPLRLISALGVLVFLASVAMVAWVVYGRIFLASTVPGWASSVIPIYFLGGIQLLCLGVIGEYVAKIYMESKHRPRYFIEEVVGIRQKSSLNRDVIARPSCDRPLA